MKEYDDCGIHVFEDKLSTGHSICLSFYEFCDGMFSPTLGISKRKVAARDFAVGCGHDSKKKFVAISNAKTGAGTLEGLLVAKFIIEYFIEEHLEKGQRIVVEGDDAQRYRVYARGLKSLGFVETKSTTGKKILQYSKY